MILDGSALAKKMKAALMPRVRAVMRRRGQAPGLLILGGAGDAAAAAYRNSQLKACHDLEIRAVHVEVRPASTETYIEALKRHKNYDAVIVDMPLPKGVDAAALLEALPASRDAEGVTPAAYGRLLQAKSLQEIESRKLIAPCTAAAILELLKASGVKPAGKTAVVLGRSNIVGKPAAHLLSCLDMTVTLCHSKTRNLRQLVTKADVVVAAVGKARFVKPGWIKRGAVVLDAGINAGPGGKLLGDVDGGAAERAGWFTPVPGGVGPVTTAMLLSNVVTLAENNG